MAWFKCGGGGIPAALKSLMNAVLNKKWGTSGTYPPETWPETVNLMGPLEEKTVSGSVVAFSDGADDVPLKSCEVTIAPTLDGVSSVDVVHCGGNIFSSEWEQGSINTSGNNQTNSNVIRTAGFIRVFEGIHYSFTRDITTDIINFRGYDAEQNYIGSGATILNLITGYSVTNPMRAGDSTCTIEIKSGSGVAYIRMNDYSNDLSVKYTMCVGDTPLSQYSPYVSTTHTANLGRTIYGGSVDVVQGTGTDEYTFDLWDGTQNYNVSDNLTNVFRIYMAHAKPLPDVTAVQCICEGYTFPRAGWSSDTVSFYSDAGNFTLKLPKTEVTTLEEAKAWLAQHNVYFLYATTPEDFTFTPVPIISRLGDNTLWSDGALSVVYRSRGTQTLIPPTLISKTITANGTYSAEDDNADGFSSVVVDVPTGATNIETVLGSNALLELTGVSGTDVIRTMWTRTAAQAETVVFHPNTQVKTNTGANDGYFKVLKNDVVVASTYANTSTTTSLSIPDIDLEAGDVLTISAGFDNNHSSCWFDLYSTITILSSESAPVLGLGLGNPGPVNEPEQEENPEEIQEETPEEVDQNESNE